jgi:hypothetical protein
MIHSSFIKNKGTDFSNLTMNYDALVKVGMVMRELLLFHSLFIKIHFVLTSTQAGQSVKAVCPAPAVPLMGI